MTREQRILDSLPATVCELAALESATVRQINAHLYNLKCSGMVERTGLTGMRYGKRGRKPSLWRLTIDGVFKVKAGWQG